MSTIGGRPGSTDYQEREISRCREIDPEAVDCRAGAVTLPVAAPPGGAPVVLKRSCA